MSKKDSFSIDEETMRAIRKLNKTRHDYKDKKCFRELYLQELEILMSKRDLFDKVIEVINFINKGLDMGAFHPNVIYSISINLLFSGEQVL